MTTTDASDFDLQVIADPDIINGYLRDASNLKGHASGLLRPTSTAEVAAIVKHCQCNSIPLTITAQRTSTTGGPVPYGGWLMSTELLNTVFSDDVIGAGVIMGEHQSYLERKGLLFPPDPTSRNECTIGAAIACNASGARSFRYGPTRNWIDAVEVVLPNGEVIIADRSTAIPKSWPLPQWQEPDVKTAAGYYPATNLLDLMIGQEGTLGVVTKAWLRLLPAPKEVTGLICFFSSREMCIQFVEYARAGAERPSVEAAADSLNPRALEYFDQHSIELIRARVDQVPAVASCGLFIEIENLDDAALSKWMNMLEHYGGLVDDAIVAEDESSRAQLYAIRHAIPAGVNEQVVANQMPKVGTDFAVPDHELRYMMDAYESAPLPKVLFGHIGDNHLHLNLLPRNAEELAFAKQIYAELALMAVEVGGTVSAEHGIGKIKTRLLAEMLPAGVLEDFVRLKRHLDPNWILGRGILMQSEQQSTSVQLL